MDPRIVAQSQPDLIPDIPRPESAALAATNPFKTPNQSTPSIPLEPISSRRSVASTSPSNDRDVDANVDLSAPENASSLPRPDGGKAAWLFLIGATSIEVLIWGIPFSIGVLHAYWTEDLFKGRGASTITLASTLQTGLLYMVAALSGPYVPHLSR